MNKRRNRFTETCLLLATLILLFSGCSSTVNLYKEVKVTPDLETKKGKRSIALFPIRGDINNSFRSQLSSELLTDKNLEVIEINDLNEQVLENLNGNQSRRLKGYDLHLKGSITTKVVRRSCGENVTCAISKLWPSLRLVDSSNEKTVATFNNYTSSNTGAFHEVYNSDTENSVITSLYSNTIREIKKHTSPHGHILSVKYFKFLNTENLAYNRNFKEALEVLTLHESRASEMQKKSKLSYNIAVIHYLNNQPLLSLDRLSRASHPVTNTHIDKLKRLISREGERK